MTAFEDFVTSQVQAGASILGLYPPTDPATKDKFAAAQRTGPLSPGAGRPAGDPCL